MNRELMIEQIVDAYIDSIYQADPEAWISDVLMFGRMDKPFCEMNDEQLKAAHRHWCDYAYEEDK